MRQRDGRQWNATGTREKCLYGGIIPVIILNRSRGLHLNHAPGTLAAFPHRQHHVGESQRPLGTETGLENRLARFQQILRTVKSGIKTLRLRIDQRSFAFWVIKSLCNIADLVTACKARLCGGGILTQARAMHFQPQSLGALPEGDQL